MLEAMPPSSPPTSESQGPQVAAPLPRATMLAHGPQVRVSRATLLSWFCGLSNLCILALGFDDMAHTVNGVSALAGVIAFCISYLFPVFCVVQVVSGLWAFGDGGELIRRPVAPEATRRGHGRRTLGLISALGGVFGGLLWSLFAVGPPIVTH